MFNQISIAEYNPNDIDNKYIITKCNEYTYKLNTIEFNFSTKAIKMFD